MGWESLSGHLQATGRVALVKQFVPLLRTYLTWMRHKTLWKTLSPLPCCTESERQRAVCLGSPGDAITHLSDINRTGTPQEALD